MSDKEYYEQLCSNSIDGTLTDSEREKLEAHLAECPSCAALKQDLEQMHALFSTEAALPDGLHEKIMQCVEQEAKLRVVQPESRRAGCQYSLWSRQRRSSCWRFWAAAWDRCSAW